MTNEDEMFRRDLAAFPDASRQRLLPSSCVERVHLEVAQTSPGCRGGRTRSDYFVQVFKRCCAAAAGHNPSLDGTELTAAKRTLAPGRLHSFGQFETKGTTTINWSYMRNALFLLILCTLATATIAAEPLGLREAIAKHDELRGERAPTLWCSHSARRSSIVRVRLCAGRPKWRRYSRCRCLV